MKPPSHPVPTAPLEDGWFDIVQKARLGLGWSLDTAAERAGVSFETLELWESGRGTPQPAQLSALADSLGLDPAKLAAIQRGEGLPEPPSLAAQGPRRCVILTGHMGGYAVHAYLLYRDGSPDAVLVDTGYEPMYAVEAVLQRRLMLRWILLTHCHRDHMEGAALLKAQTGARIAVPRAEWSTFHAHHGTAADLPLAAPADIEIGPDFTVHALPTPGHTAGGTSYLVDGLCGVGDSLFAGSTGRSMSPAGYQQLRSSLREHVLSLPGETILLPGHGPVTTVADELLHNPFF